MKKKFSPHVPLDTRKNFKKKFILAFEANSVTSSNWIFFSDFCPLCKYIFVFMKKKIILGTTHTYFFYPIRCQVVTKIPLVRLFIGLVLEIKDWWSKSWAHCINLTIGCLWIWLGTVLSKWKNSAIKNCVYERIKIHF